MTVANRLKFTVAITSAATITPPGSPNVAGYRVLAGAIAAGDLAANMVGVQLVSEDMAGNWEGSRYTVSSDGLSLARTSVVANSLGTTAPMTFTGTVTVFSAPLADWVNKLLSSADGVTIDQLSPIASTSVAGTNIFELGQSGTSGSLSVDNLYTYLVSRMTAAGLFSGATPAATAITLTGPTSGTVSVASSNFTVGVSPVGGAISGTITVTPSDNGGGGSFSPTSVALTSAAPTATFKYTPSSTPGARTISVTNSVTLTAPSSITYTSSAAAGTAATAIAVSGPTSGTVSVASTNFTASANGTITGTVVVTPSDGGAGGTFTPNTVSISSGTPTATFTYTPSATAGAKTLSFTNNGGLGNPANITYTANAAGGTTYTVAPYSSSVVNSTVDGTAPAHTFSPLKQFVPSQLFSGGYGGYYTITPTPPADSSGNTAYAGWVPSGHVPTSADIITAGQNANGATSINGLMPSSTSGISSNDASLYVRAGDGVVSFDYYIWPAGDVPHKISTTTINPGA